MGLFLKKSNLSFIVLLLILSIPAYSSEPKFDVEKGMGQLIFLHDQLASYEHGENPLGSAKVFILFKDQYDNHVQHLSAEQRRDYFWSVMWHLRFGGHYMTDFLHIVYDDCGDIFIQKLEHYIQKERELKRSVSRLEYAVRIREALQIIEDASRSEKEAR